MQSVTAGNIQNHPAATIRKKTADQNQKATDIRKNGSENNPVDVVNLSADSMLRSAESKKPSTPVSNAEKDALLRPAPEGRRISLYA